MRNPNKFFSFLILLTASFTVFVLGTACAKPNYREPVTAGEQQKPDAGTPPSQIKKCALFYSQSRLCLDYTWIEKPTNEKMGSMILKFFKEDNPDVLIEPPHQVFVQLWMPDMNHGSRPVEISKTAAGLYRADKIFFIMPGKWEIRFQLKDEKDVVEQITEKINI